jgi:hypothetical protein
MLMDIQHLVDRLEDLIDEGRHIFGTKLTMIDEERALEIIDQMRISIPEEIEKAARILAQRDRILAEAHEEAARIVQQHRDRAEKMIDDNETVQAARVRSDNMRESARQEAARITAEADQYVMSLLAKLEQQLVSNLGQVRNGITVLQEGIAPTRPSAELPAQPVHIPRPVEQHDYVDADYEDNQRYSGQ